MRRKQYLAVFMAATLTAAAMMTGCGSSDSTTATESVTESVAEDASTESSESTESTEGSSDSESENTVVGMVSEVGDSSITVSTGMGGGQGGEMPSGDGEMPSGEAPSGDGQQGDGTAPSGDGEAMEKPDGEAGEMPSGEAPSGDGQQGDGTAPSGDGEAMEKPDGEAGEMPSGEAPSGDGQSGDGTGEMPDMSNMEMEITEVPVTDATTYTDADGNAITLSDITTGTFVSITLDADGNALTVTIQDGMGDMNGGQGGDMNDQPGGGGMTSAADITYTAVTEYTTDASDSGETYTSTGTDENAILVSDGANVTLSDITVTRDSDDSTGGDNSSFYGVGAAVLVTDGSAEITDATITTDAAGGAGVFAYGDGVVTISDSTISTTQDTSGGIHAAGGGTLYANNLTVTTEGESSAAIRSDRGGGTMVVSEGSYTSNGVGSPAVYCTADITVSDAELTATGSEAVCIEGLNTLTLENCDLTGDMSDNSQNDCTWNVIVYQSMSGDSEVGNGTFSMTGGTLTAGNGGMFYTTNTECTFYLSGVDITYADENDFFLRCTGNANERGWGTTGANGSQCTFTADAQEMVGDIIYDSISTLDFTMQNGSTLTGAFVDDETYAGDGGDGYCNVTIDSSSTWIVTGDSVITSLTSEGTITDADGNTVTIVGTDGTVYAEGTSSYTVTVGSYNA